jgi:hypothetical protein
VSVEFRHTIVRAPDKHATARFLADTLGLPVGFGPFVVIEPAHGVRLDYMISEDVRPLHYAFLISEQQAGTSQVTKGDVAAQSGVPVNDARGGRDGP